MMVEVISTAIGGKSWTSDSSVTDKAESCIIDK
jgi:hypothetical protein